MVDGHSPFPSLCLQRRSQRLLQLMINLQSFKYLLSCANWGKEDIWRPRLRQGGREQPSVNKRSSVEQVNFQPPNSKCRLPKIDPHHTCTHQSFTEIHGQNVQPFQSKSVISSVWDLSSWIYYTTNLNINKNENFTCRNVCASSSSFQSVPTQTIAKPLQVQITDSWDLPMLTL